jgi:NADH-quinone oxidoreductase subunit H
VSVMIWVRWTFPRLRIDQVITTCLKYCTPIAAVALLGATIWQYQFPGRNFFGLLEVPQAVYELREGGLVERELEEVGLKEGPQVVARSIATGPIEIGLTAEIEPTAMGEGT